MPKSPRPKTPAWKKRGIGYDVYLKKGEGRAHIEKERPSHNPNLPGETNRQLAARMKGSANAH